MTGGYRGRLGAPLIKKQMFTRRCAEAHPMALFSAARLEIASGREGKTGRKVGCDAALSRRTEPFPFEWLFDDTALYGRRELGRF